MYEPELEDDRSIDQKLQHYRFKEGVTLTGDSATDLKNIHAELEKREKPCTDYMFKNIKPQPQVSGSHYEGKIEPIEFIEANNIPFHEANAIKYLFRWKNKNGIEDLKKAKWYIDRLIEINSL